MDTRDAAPSYSVPSSFKVYTFIFNSSKSLLRIQLMMRLHRPHLFFCTSIFGTSHQPSSGTMYTVGDVNSLLHRSGTSKPATRRQEPNGSVYDVYSFVTYDVYSRYERDTRDNASHYMCEARRKRDRTGGAAHQHCT